MNRNVDDDEVRPEYGFSRGKRGKHYAGTDAVFHIPVYLAARVKHFETPGMRVY